MRTLFAGLLGLLLLPGVATPQRWEERDARRDRIERHFIDFEVVRTRLVRRECERCGYDLGVFRVETRLYTEYLGGRHVRTWRETEEFFDRCGGAPIRFGWK